MTDRHVLNGSCHCGRLSLRFETAIAPADYHPRACDCSFCVKHDAAYISDPQGALAFRVKGEDALSRYRQGSGAVECLICRDCGVYVGAIFEDAGQTIGTVNARCIDGDVAFGERRTVSPQQLGRDEKVGRWQEIWTPVTGVEITGA